MLRRQKCGQKRHWKTTQTVVWKGQRSWLHCKGKGWGQEAQLTGQSFFRRDKLLSTATFKAANTEWVKPATARPWQGVSARHLAPQLSSLSGSILKTPSTWICADSFPSSISSPCTREWHLETMSSLQEHPSYAKERIFIGSQQISRFTSNPRLRWAQALLQKEEQFCLAPWWEPSVS